jgi:FG-GAP-like repeat
MKFKICMAILPMLLAFLAAHQGPNSHVSADRGEKLARQWCASCHAYTPPDLFDQQHWDQQILPRMAWFMGVYEGDTLPVDLKGQSYIFPEKPMLARTDFEAIRQFYLREAPAKLPNAPVSTPVMGLSDFKVHVPDARIVPPGSTMVRIDQNGLLELADVYASKMFMFALDSTPRLLGQGRMPAGTVALHEQADTVWYLNMGSFSPNDRPEGSLVQVNRSQGMGFGAIEGLRRPVDMQWGDLNGDGQPEVVISEFGRYLGRLAWWSGQQDKWTAHTLLDRSGALCSRLHDMDHDGDLDIVALFGQADEGIWQFTNNGKGEFTPKRLLTFGPANGSTSFELVDWNGDKQIDILYTCGDNADFSPPVVKSWHGIYIFQQQKTGFKATWFYAMPGAYRAVAYDFDGDRDLDIAANAFFPDYNEANPRGFVLLRQQSKGVMQAQMVPEVQLGRWAVMETGDPDQDGDIDIVLGSMLFEAPGFEGMVERWKADGVPFIWLENQLKSK